VEVGSLDGGSATFGSLDGGLGSMDQFVLREYDDFPIEIQQIAPNDDMAESTHCYCRQFNLVLVACALALGRLSSSGEFQAFRH
jgi:hypothetical protein